MDRNRHMATRTATTPSTEPLSAVARPAGWYTTAAIAAQADEALRRARSADRDIHRAIARRTGLAFLRGLTDLSRCLPSPAGPALRVTVTVIGTGEELGSVDIDSTNLGDLGSFATRRAATFQPNSNPTPVGKPALHLVGGAR